MGLFWIFEVWGSGSLGASEAYFNDGRVNDDVQRHPGTTSGGRHSDFNQRYWPQTLEPVVQT
jgi:hypothetical protein